MKKISFCCLIASLKETLAYDYQHPTDALTDIKLLKEASKWFKTNEMLLLHPSENALKNEFTKHIIDNKIAYKDDKSLRKAAIFVENIRKQKVKVISLLRLLAPYRLKKP